jgi:dienelactone hydrolase
VPPAQRDAFAAEMQAAGVDWRLVVYGGALHAFHHPLTGPRQELLPGVGYHPRHAQRAWRDITGLLAECLSEAENPTATPPSR